MKKLILTVLLTLIATPASAQFVLKGGEIHTVSGEVIPKGSVLIGKDGKIEAVDKVVLSPPGYEVVNCEGKVITPGLIDINTSLGLGDIWAVRNSVDGDGGTENDKIRSAFRAADALNPNNVAIPITRTGGVTSIVAVPWGGLVSGQGAWVDLGGENMFSTLVDPYVVMSMHLGESGSNAAGGSRGLAMLRLRELYDDVAFFKQNARNFDQNRSRTLAASRLDLVALQDTVGGAKPVFIEAQRASDILAALEFAKAQKLKPVIVGGAEAWMVAEQLKEANVPVILHSMSNLPFRFEALGNRGDAVDVLHRAGVNVLLSSFESHNVRNLRQYAGNAVRTGLPHDVALKAITLGPATALGKDKDYGSLEKGKMANVVVWSGDPFEHSTRVERMFIAGKDTSLDNRQQRLMEKYRNLDRRAEPAKPGYEVENKTEREGPEPTTLEAKVQ